MSSHHVVRENQEPALLIDEVPQHEAWKELLEWSPTLVVTETALEACLNLDVKIDVVICRESSFNNLAPLLVDQQPVQVIRCREEEDLLHPGLHYLLAKKHHAVNILATPTQAYLKELADLFGKLLVTILWSNDKKMTFHSSGKFAKWYPAGQQLEVMTANNMEVILCEADGRKEIMKSEPFWLLEQL